MAKKRGRGRQSYKMPTLLYRLEFIDQRLSSTCDVNFHLVFSVTIKFQKLWTLMQGKLGFVPVSAESTYSTQDSRTSPTIDCINISAE